MELAIAIFVLALLLGSILVPLATQVQQRQIADTQKILDEIREALLGFATTNGYLPCPDRQVGSAANDGTEDVDAATGRCTNISGTTPNALAAGNLPWASLGVGHQDAWGNRFRYTVLETYARRTPATSFNLNTSATGGLRVCSSTGCGSPATLTSTAVAVVISHGSNGRGAINANTNLSNPPPASVDEANNANNDREAVSRPLSTVTGNEFDDLVVWLPRFIVNNRMITAGRLP